MLALYILEHLNITAKKGGGGGGGVGKDKGQDTLRRPWLDVGCCNFYLGLS